MITTLRARILMIFCALQCAGCAVNPRDMWREPHLTPVGAGVIQPAIDIPVSAKPIRTSYHGNSFWQDESADMFRDQRAMNIGDVVTVKISIKDRATIENDSERSRDATNDLNAGFDYSAATPGYTGTASGEVGTAIGAKSTHKGK